MNHSLSRRTKTVFTRLALSALLFLPGANPALAQGAKKTAPSSPEAQSQPVDKEYTDSILKSTTEKFFLTELVDHLPASDKVPTPAKVLGYPVGTPNKLTYTKDLYRYFRELEKASPRVKIFTAPEKTEMGKEQILVVISDEVNLSRLARYKEITAKLGDPRTVNDAEAKRLLDEGKVFYWASGSIHSPETGSCEML